MSARGAPAPRGAPHRRCAAPLPAPRATAGTQLRVPREHIVRALRAMPRDALQQALLATLARLRADARSGRGVLSEVLGREAAFVEWRHYPSGDALDRRSGYRFYYHAHEAASRAAGEHGHFHVFAGTPARRDDQAAHVHLFGLSVDGRGLPTRVFATNRWVTAEHWQDARWTLRALRALDLSQARPRRVARWLQDMALLFSPQIDAVVRQRDLRIAERARCAPLQRVLEDRRSHIVSQCRIDLATQFDCLQASGIE